MRVAISAEGSGLEAPLGINFARCRYFLFVDVDTLTCEATENPWAGALSGAGVEAAKMMADRKAEAVVTGTIGPNAFSGLQEAGIPVFTATGGTVRSAVQAYRAAHLPFLVAPNVVPHSPFSRQGQVHANLVAGGGASRRRRRASQASAGAEALPGLAALAAQTQSLTEEVRLLREKITEMEKVEQRKP
ncbi:MAG: NifB/NifX family molybdenum-iron cluster-binding protein [Chloroflexi bacterium]|nr:NifB/NifX family molybdenum-iron cluster-binding protein [Chloroflexota bacterium]